MIKDSYYQKPFNLHRENNEKALLYSSGGAASIENDALLCLVTRYLKPEGQHISLNLLQQRCKEEGLDDSEVLSFLTKDIRLLSEVNSGEGVHKELVIVASGDCINYLDEALRDITPFDTYMVLSDNLEHLHEIIRNLQKPMVVLYTENYNSSLVKSLYRAGHESGNKEISFTTSYYLHDSYIIDAIYSPKKNTPCHFCHYDLWFEQALNREFTSKSSWFSFYKKANEENWPISRSLPLSDTDRQACLFYLRRKLLPFFGSNVISCYPENLVSFFQFRLPSGLAHSDIVPHSDACSCSGGEYVI